MNNARFRTDLKRIVEKTKDKTNLFVRKLVLDLDRRVILKSPVDTGRFKANWQIGYGTPDIETVETLDKSGSLTMAKHQAEVSSKILAGSVIYITNSLPYAYRLEYEGWSKQAPSGMVRITLAELNSAVQAIGAEVRLV
jgi:hypothetical protein